MKCNRVFTDGKYVLVGTRFCVYPDQRITALGRIVDILLQHHSYWGIGAQGKRAYTQRSGIYFCQELGEHGINENPHQKEFRSAFELVSKLLYIVP
jgi:hypothetical protein